MAKKLQMPKKAEKQFQELNTRFKITRREFLDYYNAVRKANKKVKTKTFQRKSLYIPSFTLNVGHIKNRKYFLEQKKRLKSVLDKDFLTKSNKEQREQLYHNLRKVLGYKNASKIINQLKELTDEQFKAFFKKNKDLSPLLYDSDAEIANFTDITTEKFISRF